MIEIIKRGTKKTCACNKCGCYFRYEDEDIEVETFEANISGVIGIIQREFVPCPQCDEKVILMQTRLY